MNQSERSAKVWMALNQAADWSNQNLATIRRSAWDYFLNRPRGDEVPGRSQVQDTTVRDFHGALMSTIMPSYATDYLVQFAPAGAGDEDAADAESNAVNAIFTEDNSGYLQLANAISDALLFRNGVLKVWVEDETDKVVRRFNAPAPQVKAYLKEQGIDAEVSTDNGVTVAEYETTTQKLRVKAIEPSYFIVDPNQQDQDLQHAAFLGERCIYTRAELLEMGVSRKLIDQLPELTDEGIVASVANSTDIAAKFVEGASTFYMGPEWEDQRTECYWCYMYFGGERWRFLMSNQLELMADRVEFFPYASGAGWMVPHRWSGLCLWDLLRNTQDSKTSILRQFLDNLNHANNQRGAYNPAETKQEDILNSAPGRWIRSTNPANIFPQPVLDIASNSLAGLAYFDDIAGKQAGAAMDLASGDVQGMKDVSGLSVEMQLGPKEQLASYVSRNLAETLVRQCFLLIHRTLRSEWRGSIMYRKSGDWQETNPGEWMPRNRLNVVVGLSPGDRRRQKASLMEVIQLQMSLIQGGTANITANWKGVHNAISDWMKSAELDGAEGYFLDPAGQESQQGQQAAGQQQQSDAQMQQQMQQFMMQLEQQKLELEAQKLQLDKYKADNELQWKYYDTQSDNELKEAELVESGIQARLAGSQKANGQDKAGRADTD